MCERTAVLRQKCVACVVGSGGLHGCGSSKAATSVINMRGCALQKCARNCFLLEKRTLSAYCADMAACGLSEAIQSLPPELREIILKEYIAIKIKEKRKWGGTRYTRIFLNCLSANSSRRLCRWLFALNMRTAFSRVVVFPVLKGMEIFIKHR